MSINAALSKITQMAVTFYSEPLTLNRYAGRTNVDGQLVDNPRTDVEIQAVLRESAAADTNSYEELERIEGDLTIHTSDPLQGDGKDKRGDMFSSDGQLYRLLMVEDNTTHGGFWWGYARQHHEVGN